MIWFTADTHFGHTSILKHCPKRQEIFNDLHTMNKALIAGINATVDRNDILYHLGDFCWQASRAGHYRQRINCRKIHIIQGNHDSSSLRKHVSSMNHMLFLKKYKMHLCHYPFESWQWFHYGGIHLHGHCHGRMRKIENRIDVGVDAIYDLIGEWRPINLEEILLLTVKRIKIQ
ncbi:MAG: metallophosphoesterase [Candidatus Thorarchaeota archaeon]